MTCFINNPKARAKIPGIVNKIYYGVPYMDVLVPELPVHSHRNWKPIDIDAQKFGYEVTVRPSTQTLGMGERRLCKGGEESPRHAPFVDLGVKLISLEATN